MYLRINYRCSKKFIVTIATTNDTIILIIIYGILEIEAFNIFQLCKWYLFQLQCSQTIQTYLVYSYLSSTDIAGASLLVNMVG